ncbi:transglycosylase SLT domain-containing protein [Citrobacter freundii]|nr:transglycosylase SLT domain-containing protein [Citrobacter freundii]
MRLFVITGLLLISSSVLSQDCFDRAGIDYHIEPDLLRAIAFKESSWRDNALNIVSPKEYSIGQMQIHSQNLPHLAHFGITAEKLYQDACLNIYTGAYYLAIAFKRWGYSWRSVGAYNAGFRNTAIQENKRLKYAQEVQTIYTSLKRDRINH